MVVVSGFLRFCEAGCWRCGGFGGGSSAVVVTVVVIAVALLAQTTVYTNAGKRPRVLARKKGTWPAP